MNHDDRPDGVRLQKVLAQAGVASRRAAEELIAAGRVSVDGKVVREMGRRVDPDTAVVHVDGDRVVLRDDLVHLALNKPFGMLSTMSDDQGRPCVGDLIMERAELINRAGRLFHVGPARRRDRGPAAAHQRRRAGPPAHAPVVRGAQDLPGEGARQRRRATSAGGCARASSWTTAWRPSTRSSWSTTCPATRWSRSCCTRAASTSCAGCSTPSAIPVRAAGAHRDRRGAAGQPAPRQGPAAHGHRGRAAVPGRGPVTAREAAPRGSCAGVVAMDGPSGTGKSTVSRRFARDGGAAYLDTGAMYRAVTLAVLRAGLTGRRVRRRRGVAVARPARLRSGTDPCGAAHRAGRRGRRGRDPRRPR